MPLQAFQLCTFTDHTSILTMRAAQHPIHIRALVTCQDSRFHPIAMKIGHQNWARSLAIDSISCCNCTCRQRGEIAESLHAAWKFLFYTCTWLLMVHTLSNLFSNHLTSLKVPKLATHNIGIIWTPVRVTTNCPPCLINAYFNPSFIGSGSIY